MGCEVIALCGSTMFQSEFERLDRELTLAGKVVLSYGVYGLDSGDGAFEVDDIVEALAIRRILDDVQLQKIDMADSILVVNPEGYIGDGAWREIVYAAMADKGIAFCEDISLDEIQLHVGDAVRKAENFASWQLDSLAHNPLGMAGAQVSFKHKHIEVFDPWIRETHQGEPFAWMRHDDPELRVFPPKHYDKRRFARYVFDTMQALDEYRQIEGNELFLPEYRTHS